MSITVNMQVIAGNATAAVGHAARLDEVHGLFPASARKWAEHLRERIACIRNEANEAEAELNRLFPAEDAA